MNTAACRQIEALEEAWRDALCAGDHDRLGELLHPDFQLIGMRSSGPFVMHRDDWLEAIRRREIINIDLDISDAFATEAMMVGTVRARWRLRYLGREIDDCVLLTDVWVREDDRWQALRRHSTPAPCEADQPRPR